MGESERREEFSAASPERATASDFKKNALSTPPFPGRIAAMRTFAILLLLVIIAAAWFYIKRRPSAPSRITRGETLAIAESYVTHGWIPAEANAFHGVDPDGIRVDTPDANFQPADDDRGWWIAGQRNVGLPYKWGGFDTPEEFDRGLRAGRFAGDVYSAEKRRLLDDAVSTHAVGIDCSGYISRCWRLPRSYSTRELPQLCEPIADLARLEPGDIFNTHNSHVRLFAAWADAARTTAHVYEAKARVVRRDIPLQQMLDEGYSAWRYRGMRK